MIDEFLTPQTDPGREAFRQAILGNRDKARAYLRDSGFVLEPDTQSNIARVICDDLICKIDHTASIFFADGRNFGDKLNEIVIILKPTDFPAIRGVLKAAPMSISAIRRLSGEEALANAGLVLEFISDTYDIRVEAGKENKRVLFIHKGDELRMLIGETEIIDFVGQMNVTVKPGHRKTLFNFTLGVSG